MITPFSSPLLFLLVAALALSASSVPVSAQESDEVFRSANADFETGDFSQAALKYQSLVDNGLISADLFYNLGTTQFRLEKPGVAMLWYRRAGILEPGAPELSQNIAFLRTRLGFLEFADSGLEKFLKSLPPRTCLWLGMVLFWSAAILLAMAVFLPALRKKRTGFLTLSIILGMFGYVALRVDHHVETQLAPENFATVIAPSVKALTAPAPGAKAVIDLPPGSEVRIIQATGPWRYVDIPGKLRGWVRAEEIEPVWPISPTQS